MSYIMCCSGISGSATSFRMVQRITSLIVLTYGGASDILSMFRVISTTLLIHQDSSLQYTDFGRCSSVSEARELFVYVNGWIDVALDA